MSLKKSLDSFDAIRRIQSLLPVRCHSVPSKPCNKSKFKIS